MKKPVLLRSVPSIRKVKQDEKRKYEPLPSVWHEEDAALLERMLDFYPRERPRRILDATLNGGRFWRESNRHIIGIDIERKHRPRIVASNTAMPFRSGVFDVVVYDPPHIPKKVCHP